MLSLLQILGAVLVLIPFVAVQRGRMRPEQSVYLALNLVGAGTLATLAALDAQWGFLLLETVWAAVAAHALVRARPARA